MYKFYGAWAIFVGLSAFLAGCAPTAPSSCQPTMLAHLPVQFADDGSPTVYILLNQKGAELLFSTGSNVSLITPRALDQFGIAYLDYSNGDPMAYSGSKGLHYVRTTAPTPLTIGNITIIEPLIVEKLDLPKLDGKEIAGFLGTDVLNRYSIMLDLPGQSISLYQAGSCGQLPMLLKSEDHGIPFQTWQGGNIIVPVSIEGKIFHLLVSTGSHNTTVQSASLMAAGLHPNETSIPSDSNTTPAYFSNITVGQETYAGKVDITPTQLVPINGIDGILGEDFLQHHVLYIDRQTLTIYVARPTN